MVESHTYAYKTFLPREDWAKVIKAFLPNPPDSGSLMEAYDRECLIQGKCLREGERGRQACEDARWSVESGAKKLGSALLEEVKAIGLLLVSAFLLLWVWRFPSRILRNFAFCWKRR